MSTTGWVWRPPPGWPQPPPGWSPPPGWQPPPDWPPPPADWNFWAPASAAPPAAPGMRAGGDGGPAPGLPAPQQVQLDQSSRRSLVFETWFVQLAFLFPSIITAVDIFAAHLGGSSAIKLFPTIIPGHPLENLILGGATYLSVGAVVPVALLLLARTGQTPATIGLGRRGAARDLLPGVGLAALAYAVVFALTLVLGVVVVSHKKLFSEPSTPHVPLTYYLIYGFVVSAVTAVTEETLVNGYLLTRLEQFGWSPGRALLLSLTLRTSYHVYYGLGFLFTIPFGYIVTRSFQKRRRLNQPIVAHFLYDSVTLVIGVLVATHT